MGKIGDFLVSQDIFGHKIGVNYKGKDSYQTKLGAFLTFATYGLILANIAYLFIALLDGSKQEEKSTLTYVDRSNEPGLKLIDHAFNLIVMSNPRLPPDIGSLVLKQKKECLQYHSDPEEYAKCDSGEDSVIMPTRTCKEEEINEVIDYWTPRVG